MTTQLTDDVYWISSCHPDEQYHMHMSEYLIQGEEGTVLVDSGSSHYREEIVAEIDRLTDGDGPDVVLLTHSTLPHTENVPAFEDEWGEIETIAATGRFPEVVGLPGAKPRQLNRPVEFAGRPITCIHPLLTDVTVSQWAFDHDSGVLFTAEAFGHYHEPGVCTQTTDELANGFDDLHIDQFYRDKIPFVDYLDEDTLGAAFETMFNILDVSYVAPIHGNPVAREDIDDYLERVMEVIENPDPVLEA
ncbi:MBL fold metallo-hydrolase [Salinadaptatus halalkaliphilus]|uniref:MBL fold metallo-hydrolase n=1 Tax=Salinadaptatus halalkaliphilus TaxID=2419781 RepID=A0A4V3VLK4_9EURY|nr:MBL fold metallo-hydrolase [Salinadaptatus halalkaliphilus]THE65987.1 MBL fold metallo-hydrolase [Salinadaptatus halalkaliphilus]